MDSILISRHVDSVKSLQVIKSPIPGLKEGEALVQIKATSLNFFDVLQVMGKYQVQPKLPFIAGFEFAGIVVQTLGDTMVEVGQKVFGGSQGSFAEYVALDSKLLIPMPSWMSFEESCGLFITAPTAWLALERAGLQKDDTVLIHAGAGGVGLMALQLSKILGARVICTVGSQEKMQVCLKNGADYAVDYNNSDWVDKVKKITKGKGCDVIYGFLILIA